MTSSNGDTTDQTRAQELLGAMAQDRARLAPRMSFPSWLLPALGAVSAAFVAGPATLDDDARQSSLLLGVDLRWWVVAPAAVTFATTLWIGRRIETIERARVADVR